MRQDLNLRSRLPPRSALSGAHRAPAPSASRILELSLSFTSCLSEMPQIRVYSDNSFSGFMPFGLSFYNFVHQMCIKIVALIYNLEAYLSCSAKGMLSASIACLADNFRFSINALIFSINVCSFASFLVSSNALHIISTPFGSSL